MDHPVCVFCNSFPAGDRSDAHASVSSTCLQIVCTMRVNAYGQPSKPWFAPAGVEPSDYIRTIREQGQALWTARLYKPAAEMYRRCIPLIAKYYGSDSVWGAQAAGQLAVVLSGIGTPYFSQEAETWAHWAFERYVSLLLLEASSPAHVSSLTEHLHRLRGAFPYVWRTRDTFRRCGIPDMTTGKLIRPRPKRTPPAKDADPCPF